MFKVSTTYVLSHEKDIVYNDIAYDGSKIYLCTSDNQIVIADDSCTIIKSIPTTQCFSTLCYDNTNHCFWATSPESQGTLFRLSDMLETEVKIELSLQGQPAVSVESLFYDSVSRHLLTSRGNVIYFISLAGELQPFFEIKDLEETPLKICILPDRFMSLSLSREELQLKQFARSDGKLLNAKILSDLPPVKSMALIQPDLSNSDFTVLLLGEQEEASPCLIELKKEYPDVQTQQLGRLCMRCPFWIGNRNCNHNYCNYNQNCCSNSCNIVSSIPDSCDNNYANCQNSNCCDSECCDSGCRPPVCHHQACSQVIESIALTETALAHILNAEGEKLQKAIACSCNVNDLLRINDSVLRTIIHSTQLEQMLFYKLEATLRGESCDCQICEPPCHAQSADAPLTEKYSLDT